MAEFGRSVVCVSGGMDSAVAASEAALASDELYFLHLNYRQRTERKELECALALGRHFRVRDTLVVDLDYLARIGQSSLTDPRLPVEEANLDRREIPNTYVPFRNANILAIATSWAETIDAGAVFIGALGEDGSGYPDCRPVFFRAFQEVVRAGTRPQTRIEIRTPVLHLDKAGVVRRGFELGTPFGLTWSCYQADDEACGQCDSCALRRRGFAQAGRKDPIPYKNFAPAGAETV